MLWILCRRVQPDTSQQQPQVCIARPVHLQQVNGSSSGWRDTKYKRFVLVPLEMVVPFVRAGMKERNKLVGQRVIMMCFGVFVSIAAPSAKARLSGSELPPKASGIIWSKGNVSGEKLDGRDGIRSNPARMPAQDFARRAELRLSHARRVEVRTLP